MYKKLFTVAVSAMLMAVASAASAGSIYITKFCSDTGQNEHFEFVQITNLGSTPVNMTGWSEDDSHDTANVSGHSLTGLGILQPGESGIITEAIPGGASTAGTFDAYWGLPASVPVVGPYSSDSLSTTSDTIYLFNASGVAVDEIAYSDALGTAPEDDGSGDSIVRNCPVAELGLNENRFWANSFIGDTFGSYRAPGTSLTHVVGNPAFYMVPEPSSFALLGIAGLLLGAGRVVKAKRRRDVQTPLSLRRAKFVAA